MKRKIFRVEQKTGNMPETAWKVVFEREMDLKSFVESHANSGSRVSDMFFSTDDIMRSLRVLFYGEQYRIVLIVE